MTGESRFVLIAVGPLIGIGVHKRMAIYPIPKGYLTAERLRKKTVGFFVGIVIIQTSIT
jgi:hypothetical protein